MGKAFTKITLLKDSPLRKEDNSMLSIKMTKTIPGSSNGINTAIYQKGKIYPTDTIPLSESLKNVFLEMGAAEVIDVPLTPEHTPAPSVAPKNKEKKTKRVRQMNKTELAEYIVAAGLTVTDDMVKEELLEIASGLEIETDDEKGKDDNS